MATKSVNYAESHQDDPMGYGDLFEHFFRILAMMHVAIKYFSIQRSKIKKFFKSQIEKLFVSVHVPMRFGGQY